MVVSRCGVIQEALRAYSAEHLKRELRELQGYWSRRAREKGVLTQRDLDRLLRR